MDKEQLSELVFASETLQKNLEEFKKLGDVGKIAEKISSVEHLSSDLIRKHIESIDWEGIVRKATTSGEKAFLESTNRLIESQKAFENAQKKAEEAVKLVDMKVLHEAADKTHELLKAQKKIKTKNIFFMGLLMFMINFGMFFGGASYFGLIGKTETIEDQLWKKGITYFENDSTIQVYAPKSEKTKVFYTKDGQHAVLNVEK